MGHLLLVTRRRPPNLLHSPECPPGLAAAAGRLVAIVLLSVSFSCAADPVRERQIAALGGETPGIPHGPLHRAGHRAGWVMVPRDPTTPRFRWQERSTQGFPHAARSRVRPSFSSIRPESSPRRRATVP